MCRCYEKCVLCFSALIRYVLAYFCFFKQKTAYEMRISDWSSDVCSSDLSAERGARDFATGDRIMFLKNERGLGVRNGTLGKVEQVSPERMAVKLDDGRSVAFDLKDYAHVDHGYAATIHKSQGVTVDR